MTSIAVHAITILVWPLNTTPTHTHTLNTPTQSQSHSAKLKLGLIGFEKGTVLKNPR